MEISASVSDSVAGSCLFRVSLATVGDFRTSSGLLEAGGFNFRMAPAKPKDSVTNQPAEKRKRCEPTVQLIQFHMSIFVLRVSGFGSVWTYPVLVAVRVWFSLDISRPGFVFWVWPCLGFLPGLVSVWALLVLAELLCFPRFPPGSFAPGFVVVWKNRGLKPPSSPLEKGLKPP